MCADHLGHFGRLKPIGQAGEKFGLQIAPLRYIDATPNVTDATVDEDFLTARSDEKGDGPYVVFGVSKVRPEPRNLF
jgi:hypothetical protein